MTIRQKLDLALQAKLNCLLIGPPGTGKTYETVQACKRRNAFYVHVILPEDAAVAEVRGHFMPSSNGGVWMWHDGPISTVRRQGGSVILDEIDHASPELATFLHAALDESPLTLPSGETLPYREDVWYLATSNMADFSHLRHSLLDRFPVRIQIERPDETAFTALSTLKGIDIAEMARRDVQAGTLSLRKWQAFKQCLEAGLELSEIATLLWPHQEQELLTAIRLMS